MGEIVCEEVPISSLNLTPYSFYRKPTVFIDLETEDYVKICLYVVAFFGAVLGNISVVLTVAMNRSMRTTINFYVVNLASADLMICACCMLVKFFSILTFPVYALGPFMCKFSGFTQMTCLTCSVLTLSAISCDRFVAIMFPLHVRITKQRTSLVISTIWVVSMAVSIPFLIVKKYDSIVWSNFVETKCWEKWPLEMSYDSTIGKCVSKSTVKEIYYAFVTVTLFFLPVAIMATSYSLIIWKLWISEVPGERHEANICVQHRAKKKVIKMVFVVLVVFIICWMPYQVTILYGTFHHSPSRDGQLPEWHVRSADYFLFIAYANSFMNPIIYGGFNKAFRDGLCIVLRCGIQPRTFGRAPEASQRSRVTVTTGVTNSPSRGLTKMINGIAKTTSSDAMKLKAARSITTDTKVAAKDTCITIHKDSTMASTCT